MSVLWVKELVALEELESIDWTSEHIVLWYLPVDHIVRFNHVTSTTCSKVNDP